MDDVTLLTAEETETVAVLTSDCVDEVEVCIPFVPAYILGVMDTEAPCFSTDRGTSRGASHFSTISKKNKNSDPKPAFTSSEVLLRESLVSSDSTVMISELEYHPKILKECSKTYMVVAPIINPTNHTTGAVILTA